MQSHYYSANRFFLEKFGGKVYKLALKGGTTCPHRTSNGGGCTFCLDGSGGFTSKGENIQKEIENAKALVASKYKGEKYIAYFQSFTATYGNLEAFKERILYTAGLNEIAAISVGTRPDCLGEEVIKLLASVNKIKPVIIELGLQTSNQNTARAINRGYENAVYKDAMQRLCGYGFHTVTHIILGLPGETKEDMLSSVSFAVSCGTNGIKLQLLHILKGTALYEEYKKTPFELLTKEEYIEILAECISILPKHIVVHRITGDGDKKALVAPLYTADKKRMLNDISSYFRQNNIYQGCKYK